MNLLIVEDEREIREHLAALPQWKEFNLHVYQADSGLAACALMQNIEMHILISDIRMPDMDGIELARWVRKRDSNMGILFLTAYNDFTYAQQAVKLHAADFLTKPVNVDELTGAIAKLIRSKSREFEQVDHHQRLVHQLLDPRLSDEVKTQALQDRLLHTKKMLLLTIRQGRVQSSVEMNFAGLSDLTLWLDLEPGPPVETLITAILDRDHHVLLFFEEIADPDKVKEYSLKLARKLLEMAKDKNISVGISELFSSALALNEAVRQTVQCLEYGLLLGSGSVIHYSAIRDFAESKDLADRTDPEDLRGLLERRDKSAIEPYLNQFYKEAVSHGFQKWRIQFRCIEMIDLTEKLFFEYGINFKTQYMLKTREHILAFHDLPMLLDFLKQFLWDVIETLDEAARDRFSETMVSVRSFIRQHYREDISLSQLAGQLNLNYFYLSRLIKKESGQTFQDLLVDYRLEMAKKRMETTSDRTYEIGYAVGFKDPSNFSKQFKKRVGMSPKAYKDSIESRSR